MSGSTFICRDCKYRKQARYQVRGKNWCKACQKIYGRHWCARNPEKKRAAEEKYRRLRPEDAKARKRRYYRRNVEHEKARSRVWYAKNWLRFSLRSARKRALSRGIPFDIVWFDIEIPKKCPVLGIELALGVRGGFKDASPTIDRVIPEKGYVKGNVAVISKRANTIKNCGTAAEHRRIAKWIESFGK